MKGATRKRSIERANRILEKFERNPQMSMIEYAVFQDKSAFPLQIRMIVCILKDRKRIYLTKIHAMNRQSILSTVSKKLL